MNKFLALLVTLFQTLALADGAPATKVQDGVTPFIPLILIFAVFYFLILRPQQKKQKEQKKFLSELKRGDRVVTNAGIIGTIRTVSEKFVTLEVDDGVCLKVLRSQVLESAANLKDDKVPAGKEATT